MRIGIAVIALTTALGTAVPASADCRYEESREVSAAAAGVSSVRIAASSGSLDVIGGTGSVIKASGSACVSDRAYLAATRLTLRREGSALVIEAHTAETRGGWWFGSSYATLPFVVELPSNLPIDVEDGSGPLTVRGVFSASIRDGSGSIEVSQVAGDVRVRDGSGSMLLERIGGTIRIRDGSGSIDVKGVGGDVIVEADGSGSIDIRDVTGNVLIEDDGSGAIEVRNVGGDFTVLNDGSGGISFKDVKGRVSLPRD
jgi:hypothetical protein